MRTIPEIRARLHELAGEIIKLAPPQSPLARYGLELRELADETKRRSPIRRARKRRAPLTEEQELSICNYFMLHPDASYHEASIALNINTARISEVLAGKREAAQ